MPLQNTTDRYGSVTQALHWSMALLIFGAWAAVEYRQSFTARGTVASTLALQLHMSLGISAGLLVVLRLVWRFLDTTPAPLGAGPLARQAARVVHIALYVFMVGMPVTGYLSAGGANNFFWLFEIPRFKDTGLFKWIEGRMHITFEEFEVPLDFLHKEIGLFLIWTLLGVHVFAALLHHFVKKDDVLRRMLPGYHPRHPADRSQD